MSIDIFFIIINDQKIFLRIKFDNFSFLFNSLKKLMSQSQLLTFDIEN